MQIFDQHGKYSYLDNWFHSCLAPTRWLQKIESIFQGGARGQNLGHLKNLFNNRYYLG